MHPLAETPFTERDALELADRIEHCATAAEKLAFYESLVEDPELAQLVARGRSLFLRHAEELMSLLRRIDERCDWGAYTQYEPSAGIHVLRARRAGER